MMNKKWFFHVAFAAALTIVVFGCGKKESEESSEQPASAPAGGGEKVDAATAGSVSGTVTLDGAAPKAKPINMSAEPYCSQAHPSPVYPDQVTTGDKGTLANVLVYVQDDMSKYSFDTPSAPVELDQKGCMYQPHVLALMTGQTLKVVNEDQTTHNVHPTPTNNRDWNKSQPPGSDPITDVFARPEVAIPVKCNVHPWMKSYIGVFKHPYFAVTGKSGSFDLANLPPGTYTIVAWHELYGTQTQQVTVGPKESKSVAFTFKAVSSGD